MRLAALPAIAAVSLASVAGCGSDTTTTIIESAPTPESAEPCTLTVSGGPAELALHDSGLECVDARAIVAEYENGLAAGEGDGSGAFIEVDGWGCFTFPLSDYPTLSKCESGGKTFTVLGTAPAAHTGGGAKPNSATGYDAINFHTPSNNIGCSLSDEFVNCAIVEADWTPDGQDCSTTNTRSVEFSGDPPTIRCGAELPVDPEGTELPGRQLAYGASIERGPYSCTSDEDALTCTNGSHGFSLSRERFDGH